MGILIKVDNMLKDRGLQALYNEIKNLFKEIIMSVQIIIYVMTKMYGVQGQTVAAAPIIFNQYFIVNM